jgi:hypothetical protein
MEAVKISDTPRFFVGFSSSFQERNKTEFEIIGIDLIYA